MNENGKGLRMHTGVVTPEACGMGSAEARDGGDAHVIAACRSIAECSGCAPALTFPRPLPEGAASGR